MSHKVAIVAFAVSVLVIIGGSLYPFHHRAPVSGLGPMSLLLLSGMRWPQWGDFLRNIVFYAPMGLLAGLVMPARVPSGQRLVLIAAFASVLSLGNEVLQYYVGRHTNAFDVCANVLGSTLGGWMSRPVRAQLGRRER